MLWAGGLVVVLLLFKNGGKLLQGRDRIVGFFDFFLVIRICSFDLHPSSSLVT